MLKQSKSRAIRARGRNDSRWRGMDVLRVSVRHVPRSSDQHTDCSLSRENACLGRSRVLSHPNSDDRFWPSVAVVCARLFGPIRLPKSPDADFLPCTVMALCRRMTVGMDVSPEPILLAIDVLALAAVSGHVTLTTVVPRRISRRMSGGTAASLAAPGVVAGNGSAMNCAVTVDASDCRCTLVVNAPIPRPRRRWCTRLSFSPCSLAMAATDAPASPHAFRTLSFNSGACRRRCFGLLCIDVQLSFAGHHGQRLTMSARWGGQPDTQWRSIGLPGR